jgi:hypothetical protein
MHIWTSQRVSLRTDHESRAFCPPLTIFLALCSLSRAYQRFQKHDLLGVMLLHVSSFCWILPRCSRMCCDTASSWRSHGSLSRDLQFERSLLLSRVRYAVDKCFGKIFPLWMVSTAIISSEQRKSVFLFLLFFVRYKRTPL